MAWNPHEEYFIRAQDDGPKRRKTILEVKKSEFGISHSNRPVLKGI
jgi:hypothetical protein